MSKPHGQWLLAPAGFWAVLLVAGCALGAAWGRASAEGAMDNSKAGAADRPLVGAIRWDAWHSEAGVPGQAVETALGPKRWHWRLPFFAEVLGEDQVRIDGTAPGVMEREIEYARRAGLDYWAFVTYDPGDSMSRGLKQYLASPLRDKINFCLIVEQGRWGHPGDYKARLERYVEYLRQPTYQKVAGGRPLVYILSDDEKKITGIWGSLGAFGAVLGEFRELARAAGLGDPYIVIMNPSPVAAKTIIDGVGADAASAYAAHRNEAGAPYANLAGYAESLWDIYRSKGVEVVPIAMAGWDRRPRVQHPVPWERWQKPMENIDRYYEMATPEELAAHVKKALEWIEAHPEAAPARAVIIYAWNENDEGGWLTPTLEEGDARVKALGDMRRR